MTPAMAPIPTAPIAHVRAEPAVCEEQSVSQTFQTKKSTRHNPTSNASGNPFMSQPLDITSVQQTILYQQDILSIGEPNQESLKLRKLKP
jgi:hypothetical protein